MTTSTLIPTFLGGISQQSAAVRRSNLVEDAVNVEFLATVGAIKRYPTEWLRTLSADLGDAKLVTMRRDDEDYLIALGDGSVRVYTGDGTNCSITGTFTYLAGATGEDIRVQAIADSLFVLNRNTVVAGAAGRDFESWVTDGDAGVFIKQVNFSTTYTLTYKDDSMGSAVTVEHAIPAPIGLDEDSGTSGVLSAGQVAGTADIAVPLNSGGNPLPANSTEEYNFFVYGTPVMGAALNRNDFDYDPYALTFRYRGSVLTAGDQLHVVRRATTLSYFLETSWVARKLREKLQSRVPGFTSANFEFIDDQDSMFRIHSANVIETLTLKDSNSDTFSSGWTNSVAYITDLPLRWKHGAVVRVAGENTDGADDYWVRFEGKSWTEAGQDPDTFSTFSAFEDGVWAEAVAPGLLTGSLTASKMPHVLRRTGATTFAWEAPGWSQRAVGDEDTNKVPSFVGNSLNDIFYHEGRLGFLSQNSMVLSESSEPLNFWRTTTLSVPGSDRIDVELSGLDGESAQHAIPYNRALYVFSRSHQIAVYGNPFLTPDSIEAPHISSYQCYANVKPVRLGQSMFFANPTAQWAQVREFVPGQDLRTVQDAPVTLAVPRLIPTGLRRMTTGSLGETLVLHSGTTPNQVYIYSFLRFAGNLAQASWSTWDFGVEVQDVAFLEDRLVVLLKRGAHTQMEVIRLGAGRSETDEDFVVRLDQQVKRTTGAYDRDNDRTPVVLPYTLAETGKVVAGSGGDLPFGAEIAIDSIVGTTTYLVGDHESQPIIAGLPYLGQITLSKPLVKVQAGEGETSILGGSSTVRNLHLYCEDTGYLVADVQYIGGDVSSDEFLADFMSSDIMRDSTTLRSGEFSVPIHAMVDDFKVTIGSTSALPFNLISGQWDVRFNTRYGLRPGGLPSQFSLS